MEDQSNVVSIVPLEEYPINYEYLRRLMIQQGLSYPALEHKSGVPESTLRKLMQGKTKDPRVASLLPVVRALGGSADLLFGLAATPIPAKEQTAMDVAVMDAMRTMLTASMQQYSDADATAIAEIGLLGAQVAELKQLVADQDERLGYKRDLLSDQRSEIARLNERVEAREATITSLRKAIKWICIGSGAAILTMFLFAVFCIWDISAFLV